MVVVVVERRKRSSRKKGRKWRAVVVGWKEEVGWRRVEEEE